jgi:hypothetical protein
LDGFGQHDGYEQQYKINYKYKNYRATPGATASLHLMIKSRVLFSKKINSMMNFV